MKSIILLVLAFTTAYSAPTNFGFTLRSILGGAPAAATTAEGEKISNDIWSAWKAWTESTDCVSADPQYDNLLATEDDKKDKTYADCLTNDSRCINALAWRVAFVNHPLAPVSKVVSHCYNACVAFATGANGIKHKTCFKAAIDATTFPKSIKEKFEFTPNFSASKDKQVWGQGTNGGYWLCTQNNLCWNEFTEYNYLYNDPWYDSEHLALFTALEADVNCAAAITSGGSATEIEKLDPKAALCTASMLKIAQHVERPFITCLDLCANPTGFLKRGDGTVDDVASTETDGEQAAQKATVIKEYYSCVGTCPDMYIYKSIRPVVKISAAVKALDDYENLIDSTKGPDSKVSLQEDESEQLRNCFQWNEHCIKFKKWAKTEYRYYDSYPTSLDLCYNNCFTAFSVTIANPAPTSAILQWYTDQTVGKQCYDSCKVTFKSKWENQTRSLYKISIATSSQIISAIIISLISLLIL